MSAFKPLVFPRSALVYGLPASGPQEPAATKPASNDAPDSAFARDFVAGLLKRPRRIPPKHFYDAVGSALFDEICAQPEYYLTRTEVALLSRHAEDIAARIGPDVDLIEFGAGSALKVRLLLEALPSVRRYVPIDISGEHLQQAAAGLRQDHPGLRVEPLAADFTQPFSLPQPADGARCRVGLYFGSSLGNFEPDEALRFMRTAAGLLRGGGLLIGVDLVKDPAVLHAAYNDAAGVTARFNLNLLQRANRELGADFDLTRWAHYACYQPLAQRVEMHLVALDRQLVRMAGQCFEFAPGDSLHTENSHKYTLESLRALARQAGFGIGPVWLDGARGFALQWLPCCGGAVH